MLSQARRQIAFEERSLSDFNDNCSRQGTDTEMCLLKHEETVHELGSELMIPSNKLEIMQF